MKSLKQVKREFKEEKAVFEGDLELLEKLFAAVESFKDYEEKDVNRWFERRLEAVDQTFHILKKESWQAKDDFIIATTKSYEFDENYPHVKDSTIMLYVETPNEVFDYQNFKEVVVRAVKNYRKKAYSFETENIERAYREYRDIYQGVIDFKNAHQVCDHLFDEFEDFFLKEEK